MTWCKIGNQISNLHSLRCKKGKKEMVSYRFLNYITFEMNDLLLKSVESSQFGN